MKVTRPSDVSSKTDKLQELIAKFEIVFEEDQKDMNHYHLVVYGEYNRDTCDKVVNIYSEAGWRNVKCRTSSESGERPGLTGLHLTK